ncbi:hypothetical protein [Haloterrigena salinisoli]|uniref:hypothetical protein n=1 Tax=Haloterrigena salinisoli TaxID=3132747 RepID=UPI0030CBCB23
MLSKLIRQTGNPFHVAPSRKELAAQARAAIDRLEFDAETTRKLHEFTEFVIEREA